MFISYSEVTLDDVRNAIQSVDPDVTQDTLDKYIKRGFNSPVDKIEPTAKIESTLLIKRLQTGSVKRIGKKA
jgi:predicted transport protein